MVRVQPSFFSLHCGSPELGICRNSADSTNVLSHFIQAQPVDVPIPIPSMGLVYSPTLMVDFYGFHVGQ